MILINSCQYGVPNVGVWFLRTMEIIYWLNMAVSAIASAVIYLILWSSLYAPSVCSEYDDLEKRKLTRLVGRFRFTP